MRNYCTYFDSNYMVKGLALYRSLVASGAPFTLWVLALDEPAGDVLRNLSLEGMRVIRLAEFESGDPELAAAKANRSRVEYFFTCTPSLPLYVLRNAPGIGDITYLDSDLYCFSDPEPVFDAMGSNSILITPHRFPERLRDRERYGIYNVGVVAFRNDRRSLECLRWWRQRCLEWCHDRLEGTRFGDQGYLNDWPERFEGVAVLEHKGVNTAPWNWMSSRISRSNGQVFIDDDALIFFHFHQLKQINGWICDPGLASYGGMSRELKRWIYAPYLGELKETWRWLHRRAPNARAGYARFATSRESARALLGNLARSTMRRQLMLTPGRTVI